MAHFTTLFSVHPTLTVCLARKPSESSANPHSSLLVARTHSPLFPSTSHCRNRTHSARARHTFAEFVTPTCRLNRRPSPIACRALTPLALPPPRRLIARRTPSCMIPAAALVGPLFSAFTVEAGTSLQNTESFGQHPVSGLAVHLQNDCNEISGR